MERNRYTLSLSPSLFRHLSLNLTLEQLLKLIKHQPRVTQG